MMLFLYLEFMKLCTVGNQSQSVSTVQYVYNIMEKIVVNAA